MTAGPGAATAALERGPAGPDADARTALAFTLPPEREAHEPPEARDTPRDGVALMVSRGAAGEISHHAFTDLPALLLPGDLLVVNTSATLPAAVPLPGGLAVHFSTSLPDGDWLVELRAAGGAATAPYRGGSPGQRFGLPGGAVLVLGERFTARLWRARLSTAVVPYLLRHGEPIRYSYVRRPWPIASYQTIFGARPGSAEMPSASRPFTPEVVARLVARGITFAPVTLHTGVSSLEGDEDPYPEPYDVPPATARLVNLTRRHGGRVIAVGTTVVRALETAARVPRAAGAPLVSPAAGWTGHIVTPAPGHRLLAVDGLVTGLHEPRSSHLRMLAAFAGTDLLGRCYAAAIDRGYLWHEFGDLHLLLP
ncbi:MAG TPA: S-adenosylmethionine:tRNA ribosyltransferase-isomerase [Streptosporangiaceae bacterium]|nr:S-adenosylmethionine:tRNA ribosyltransferase-isomerase [Streptosporangiaceae bacterium]